VSRSAARLAWYRFRVTFRRRLGGYLALAILTGLIGGLAMASMTAARRTDSSYPDYLASTNPSGLIVQPNSNFSSGESIAQVYRLYRHLLTQLRHLPHVRAVATADAYNAALVTPRGGFGTVLFTQVQLVASRDGMFTSQGRLTITAGRKAVRPDEVVATSRAAALLRLHVGSRLRVGIWASSPKPGLPSFFRKLDLTVTGIGVVSTQIVQDDIDTNRTGFLIGTPALDRELVPCCTSTSYIGLQVAGGSRYDAAVGQEYESLENTSSFYAGGGAQVLQALQVYNTAAIEAEAQRSIRPEAIALGVFGLIAGLAALIIGAQSVSRQLQAAAGDAEILRALGAGPAATIADGSLGVLAAAAAGALIAVAVAVGLSPFSLFGPVRQAVLAVIAIVATLTFGASLNYLVSRPALYGWNFSYALYSTDGWGPFPPSLITPLLHRDRLVAATTGVYFLTVQVDGQTVPVILSPAHPEVTPRILSGHGLDSAGQIVLGPATLAQLHKKVSDEVTVQLGPVIRDARLRIAGTAVLPAIGDTLSMHPSLSTGAILATGVVSPTALYGGDAYSGPNAILVRMRPGVSQAAGLESLQRITTYYNHFTRSPQIVAAAGPTALELNASVLPVQRPAEIVNYRSMGTVPVALAGGVAAGTVAALGLTLVASVRRRRRDLALLKTLGFTRGQLAGAVAFQSTVVAVVGLIIGVPLGIAAGRWLWILFAHQLSAVPDPVIPASSITVAAVAALVLANLVAAVPGRQAARTPAGLLLRAE